MEASAKTAYRRYFDMLADTCTNAVVTTLSNMAGGDTFEKARSKRADEVHANKILNIMLAAKRRTGTNASVACCATPTQ